MTEEIRELYKKWENSPANSVPDFISYLEEAQLAKVQNLTDCPECEGKRKAKDPRFKGLLECGTCKGTGKVQKARSPEREKIACLICGQRTSATCLLVITNLSAHWCEKALKIADQIIALFPDVEEAKREERERIRERIKTARVVCLCGSTRFTGEMLVKQWELTKQGCIVVSWCALPDNYFDGEDKTHIGDQEGVKDIVDEVHKRKIDLCDEVFVLNIDGYIGESTASEIAYAEKICRPIKYWQALKGEK